MKFDRMQVIGVQLLKRPSYCVAVGLSQGDLLFVEIQNAGENLIVIIGGFPLSWASRRITNFPLQLDQEIFGNDQIVSPDG